jgi:hypothetical protein
MQGSRVAGSIPGYLRIGVSPHDFVGLLGLIGTRAILVPGLLTGFASSATGTKGTATPIDPAMLAKSIGTLTDLQP